MAMKLKKYINFLLRFAVTFLLIIYILSKIETGQILNALYKINLLAFFSASFLYIVSSYISALRWRLFIVSDIKPSQLFSLYLIGSFFNIALPGIIGGDAVKILLLRKKTGIKEAFASVFMERYVGFFALIFIGFVFFLLFYSQLPHNPVIYAVPLSFFGFFVATFFLLLVGRYNFLRDFRQYILSFKKTQILKAFCYSIVVQFIVIVTVYIIGRGLGLYINFFELAIFLPVIVLITTLPVSLSGIGVREGCFILFFGSSIGEANAVVLSFVWFLSVVFASLFGAVEYLKFKDSLDMKEK